MCTNLLISVPTDPSGTPMHVSARCLELSGTLPTSLYVVPRGLSFPQDDPPVAPGSAPDTHTMSPSGVATICRFMPCFLCFPE